MPGRSASSHVREPVAGRREELLRALNAAAASLQRSARSEAEVFRALKEQIELLGLNGGLGLLDETGQRLVFPIVAVPGTTLARLEQLTGLKAEGFSFEVARVDVYRQVLETGQAVFVPDNTAYLMQVLSEQILPKPARPFVGLIRKLLGKNSGIFAPLVADGQVRGVLNVTGAGLTPGDVPAMEAFANHIAVALDNARLFASMQQELHERQRVEKAQAVTYRIAEATLAASSLEMLYHSIHQIIGELMPAKNFYIALYDEATELLSWAYFVDEHDKWAPPQKLGKGLTEYVLRTGQPLLATPEVFEELQKQGEVELIGAWSIDWLGVPLIVQNKSIGVLAVQTYTEGVRYSEEDRNILTFVSAQAAMAIARRQAEEALRESKERFQLATQATNDAIWDLNILTNEAWWNERHYTLIGYQPGEIEPGFEAWSARIHPEDKERVLSGFRALIEDGGTTWTVEYRFCRVDGSIGYVFDRGHIVRDADGKPTRMIGAVADITERKRAEEALRESEARYHSLFDGVPVGLYRSKPGGQLLVANSALVQMLGYADRASLLAANAADIYVKPDETRARWRALFEREGIVRDFEAQARQRDGTVIWIRQRARAVRDGDGQVLYYEGVIEDITERKRAEEALRASEARYRTLVEQLPAIIYIDDVAGEPGRTLYVSPQVESVLGITPAEWINEDLNLWSEHIHPDDRERVVAEYLRCFHSGEPLVCDYRMITRRGQVVWFRDEAIMLRDAAGAPRFIQGVMLDITELRQAEEALRQAQKMESLGILAGGIAHDFNNLLVALLGQASLALARLPPASAARAHIEKAVKAAERAADLTRQMLAYSGRGQFEVRPLHLNTLIQENLHLFEVAVPKNVHLRSELAEPLPLVEADAGQMQQVIMNLIINAAEAIGERPGAVTVVTGVRALDTTDDPLWQPAGEPLTPGRYVTLDVHDDGHGMDAETLSKIFDPFFTTKFTGRGLGLAAVLGIVRGHKGGLRVYSEVGKGTTFRLAFPAVAQAEGRFAGIKAEGETSSASLTPHPSSLVLVIDDEAPVREAVTDILELDGWPVLTAPNGAAGIALYRERQAEVGLVLLDLSMPDLSGEETFHELRKINPDVRVALSSGYNEAEATRQFAGQGLAGFIQKPYDAAKLVKEVRKYLG